MKTFKNITLLFILVFTSFSCQEVLDINEDPNKTDVANVNQVLTSSQVFMTDFHARLSGTTCNLWSQYWTWGPGVALGPDDRHEFPATSSNGVWTRAYATCLKDLDYIIDSGEDIYGGIAKILTAYIYGMLVDFFDDVPFSEALRGTLEDGGITSPKYDDAATIYASLITMIDEAKEQITNPEPGSDLAPGADDIMYAGDLNAWLEAANSLKLKLLIRQTMNGGPEDLATQVADVIAEGNFIEDADHNLQVKWSGTGGSRNPYNELLESGLGNFYVLSNTSKDFLENVVEDGDPRLDVYYAFPGAAPGVHAGSDQGNIINEGGNRADYSTPSSNVFGISKPTIFMSATEVWFYRAEAAERFGTEDATTTFEAAVKSSFDYWDLDDAVFSDYIDELNYSGAADKMKLIAEQMWVAFNATQAAEGWITTRKFDNASNNYFATNGILNSPTDNTLGGNSFPSIWRYPQSEIDANTNISGANQHELTDKVFWDN